MLSRVDHEARRCQSIARARGLPREEHPLTQREIIEDILSKVSLPESIKQDMRKRHGL